MSLFIFLILIITEGTKKPPINGGFFDIIPLHDL